MYIKHLMRTTIDNVFYILLLLSLVLVLNYTLIRYLAKLILIISIFTNH